MPTQRQHGGAVLAHFPLTSPGFFGLNTEHRGTLLGPEWATKLDNTVMDSSGRISARRGWSNITSSPHGSKFTNGIEYRKQDGTVQLVVVTATQVLSSTDGAAWTDVTGTAAFTSGEWYLVNFNDYVIGFQAGEKPLIYNGTTASQVADATAPTGGAGTSAFGRVWAVDSDGVTIRYSDLLDHTNWTTGSSGFMDMSSIWIDNDRVIGITAFNNLLVVFGERNTVVWADDTGSELGIDPVTMRVIDTIPGLGLLTQHSIQHVGGDLWFVGNNRELMSFGRVMVEQNSGNLTTLSRNTSSLQRDSIDSGSTQVGSIRSVYSPKDRFYLLSLPAESGPGAGDEVGKVFVYDTSTKLQDGSARCVGIWNQLVPTVAIYQQDQNRLLFALNSKTGKLGAYSTGQDDTTSYYMSYESGWIDITKQGYLLILKRLNGLFFFDITTTVFMKWAFDFNTTFFSKELVFATTGGNGAWGTSEWGLGEWGGGIDLFNKRVNGQGTGEFIKVGADVTIDGGSFALQQIDLLAKVGRIKG